MSNASDNQRKLSGFFAKEYKQLLSFVKSYWGGDSEADAEDVLQDVLLNLYTKVDFNRPIENLLAYTYRSLRNRVIDRQRKRKDQVLSEYDDEENGENRLLRKVADDSVSTEDAVERENEIERMMDRIGDLRPDQQEILIRTELEGYTFDELSKEWNVPIGTLLSRKHRAMAKLQKLMSEHQKNNI
jgi:RNA polymerase sigma-70 factor (ECF subfamily)